MLLYLALILAIAALFYLGIPGLGAFLVRAQWRHFRTAVLAMSRYPTFNARVLRGHQKNDRIGDYRFFGSLEAIQGDDRIWVTDGSHTAAAELKKATVYVLPASAGDGPAPELRAVQWNRMYSLPQGTPILIGGALFTEDGRGVFRPSGGHAPLVLIHDCRREEIMQRVIGAGRQRNEYWNLFTVPSLITGAFALFLMAYFLLGAPDQRIPALIALAVGAAPATPFLPPAFPLYFFYRRYWRRARAMRAQRDTVRLPLRYFPGFPTPARGAPQRDQWAVLLPDLEPYLMLKGEERKRPPGSPAAGPARVFHSAEVEVAVPPETARVEVSLPPRLARRLAPGSYAFGSYVETGGGIALARPEDPMAELVVVPGNPEEIAAAASRASRAYTFISAMFVGVNVLVNETAVLLLLARFIG